ncbi:MAG: C4-type zinc ribbon domain-containing protein, partial [Corynebacterium sp.]|nr:C4-type zinc ribbon domain-containing protein [Corynebacterium sp.]
TLVKEELEGLQSERESEIQHLSDEEYENYELVRERKNGIAVAVLQDGGCSVCGAQYNDGQLYKIKNGEEVSTCPSCSRILVRQKLDEYEDEE